MRHLAICSLALCVLTGAGAAETTPTPAADLLEAAQLRWYQPPDGGLPVAECTLPPDVHDGRGAQRLPYARLQLQLAAGDDDDQLAAVPVLYPVLLGATPDALGRLRVLFRVPRKTALAARAHVALETDLRMPVWRRGDEATWQAGVDELDQEQGATLLARWRDGFRRQLDQRIAAHEDHELELLLHWRFFGQVPSEPSASWKRDPNLRILYTFSGLRDIQDAIPASSQARLADHVHDQAPPEPILLPRVEAPDPGALEGHPLARWVPRSCYYVAWPDTQTCLQTLEDLAALFDQWSGPLYPGSGADLLAAQLKRVGLTADYRRTHLAGATTAIALAGWDPYFRAGTNFMVLIASDGPLALPPDVPFTAQPEPGITILATGEKLRDRALAAYDKGRSMLQEPHFVSARKRLTTAEGEREWGFVYLSDYWLTNLVSPRWQILRSRLLQVEARIRLAHLLKAIAAAEHGAPVPLAEIDLLPEADRAWLLEGLVEDGTAIRHHELGGLYDHPPIDSLPFDQVSQEEHASYERFRRTYVGRWRQMDPIAYQLVATGKRRWTSRLYIAPIGRRSEFGMLRRFVLPSKVKHRLPEVPGIALGLSVVARSQMLQGMTGVPLPLQVGAQLLTRDFAPKTYAPHRWLHPAPPQDMMSWMRTPASVLAPRLLVDGLLGAFTRNEPGVVDDNGFRSLIPGQHPPGFPLLAYDDDTTGLTAIGTDVSTLRHIRTSLTETVEGPVACDLHLWADLVQGYQLKRKFLQLLVANRTIAAWRRTARLERIRRALGYPGDGDEPTAPLATGVFPSGWPPAGDLAAALPPLRLANPPAGRPWSTRSATEEFSDLPRIVRDLARVDVFISIEEDALFFETRLAATSPLSPDDAPPPGVTDEEPAEAGSTTLDFDE